MSKEQDTTVVNVKVKHIRPRYTDLRAWMEDPQNVYVGRKGVVLLPDPVTGKKSRYPLKDSLWANPFKVKNESERAESISKYKEYIKKKIIDEGLQDELEKLRGKTLGCWCMPLPCHSEVLVELLALSSKE